MINHKKAFVLLFGILCLFFTGCEKSVMAPESPSEGILIGYEGCKTHSQSSGSKTGLIPSSKECLEYEYDQNFILHLKHINAGFNCCPKKIYADITISGNTITIEEKEQEEGCFCLCLFDVKYQILNLNPGEYTIKITGPCLEEQDPAAEFNLKLHSPCSGVYCIDRTHYPWGN
jgi:hypothetical protein